MTLHALEVSGLDEADLLRDFVATGSPEAFRQIVERHLAGVHGAARRMLGVRLGHHADDVAQSVFMLLAQQAGAIGGGRPLVGWLYKVTYYACLNVRRVEGNRRRHEEGAAAMKSTVEEAARVSDAGAVLDEALVSLGSRDRDVLLLRYGEDFSVVDIARRTGVPVETAKKRLRRAIQKLRRHFARRGFAGAMPGALLGMAPAAAALGESMVRGISAGALAPGIAGANSVVIAKGVSQMMIVAKVRRVAAGVVIVGAVLVSSVLIFAAPGRGGAVAAGPVGPVAIAPAAEMAVAELEAKVRAAYRGWPARAMDVTFTQNEPNDPVVPHAVAINQRRVYVDDARVDLTSEVLAIDHGKLLHYYSGREVWDGRVLVRREEYTSLGRLSAEGKLPPVQVSFSVAPGRYEKLVHAMDPTGCVLGIVQHVPVADLLVPGEAAGNARAEKLGENPCWYVAGRSDVGAYEFWFDAVTFLLRKAVLEQKADGNGSLNMVGEGGPNPQDGVVAARFEYDEIVIKTVEGVAIPVHGVRRNSFTQRDGKAVSSVWMTDVTGVRFHPNFEEMGAFVMDRVAEGQGVAPVAEDGAVTGEYVWHAGRVVEKDTMDEVGPLEGKK